MVCLSVAAGQAIPAGKHQGRMEFAYDGGKTYKVTLPGPVPVGQFWSFIVYDNQTRSILETDQKLDGIGLGAGPGTTRPGGQVGPSS